MMIQPPENKIPVDPGPIASAETRLRPQDLHGEIERGATAPGPPPKLLGSSVTLTVSVKNPSDRVVSEFWWDVALTDMTGSPEYARRLVHSGSPLKAGQSKKVTTGFPFNKHWAGFKFTDPPNRGKILRVDVVRVVYVDGTEWRGARPRDISPRPFSLHSRTSYKKPDGDTSVSNEVFYLFSDGSFRHTREAEGSRPVDVIYLPSHGRFMIDHLGRKLIKEVKQTPVGGCGLRTGQDLRNSTNFFREEELLGVTTYVHRFADPLSGNPLRDVYYAPELGCKALKVVFYRGGEVERVTEPVSLTFGEPDRALLQVPD